MSKMIQVRNVPDEVHRKLKSRAASQGMSLSDYAKKELEKSAHLQTMHEWLDQASRLPKLSGKSKSGTQIIREMRDALDRV